MHVKASRRARTMLGVFQLLMRIIPAKREDWSKMTETGKGELSASLAARLPLELRGALDHPCRRRILRALREDGGQLRAAEIRARGCSTCTLSCVTYHLGVLAQARLVRRLDAGSVRGRLEYAFAATLDGQPTVVEVLRATAAADGLRPAPAPA